MVFQAFDQESHFFLVLELVLGGSPFWRRGSLGGEGEGEGRGKGEREGCEWLVLGGGGGRGGREPEMRSLSLGRPLECRHFWRRILREGI